MRIRPPLASPLYPKIRFAFTDHPSRPRWQQCLTGSGLGLTWERTLTTERLRPSHGSYGMPSSPNSVNALF